MTTGIKVGGNHEDSINGYSDWVHHFRLCLFEQAKKEKVTGRAASQGAAHSIGGRYGTE